MKVLIVTSEFPPQPGGIGHHACNLAKYLNKQGVPAAVFCESRKATALSEERAYDAELSFQIFRIARADNMFSRYVQRVRQLLHSSGMPDQIILASGYWPLLLVGLMKLLGLRRQHAIYIAHAVDVNPSNAILKAVCHFLLARFDRIISVSEFTKLVLPQHLQAKTTVILNGFDLERFAPNGMGSIPLQGKPSLITLGSLTARKGQINVVNALPEVLKVFPEAHYHLIGIPVEQNNILAQASELGVDRHVHIHGALADEAMIEKLQQADVFVMLSNHTPDGDFEGFGIAILEAGYLGVPAIGSKGSGIEDAIKDRVSGCLVDPLRKEEVVAAIQEVMEKHSFYREESRKHAKAYTWDRVVPRYILELKSLKNHTQL